VYTFDLIVRIGLLLHYVRIHYWLECFYKPVAYWFSSFFFFFHRFIATFDEALSVNFVIALPQPTPSSLSPIYFALQVIHCLFER
jgi:hypothetical protein